MVLIPKLLFYAGARTGVSVGLQISFRTTVSFFFFKKKAFLFGINSLLWFVTVLHRDKTKQPTYVLHVI